MTSKYLNLNAQEMVKFGLKNGLNTAVPHVPEINPICFASTQPEHSLSRCILFVSFQVED